MKKRVLILSGPTHEYIDPVRFIGNASSGKMGCALAEEALRRGFAVEFVTGPVASEHLPNLEPDCIHPVVGAQEMLEAAQTLVKKADILLFAAAVSDYAPAEKRIEKRSKSNAEWMLRLRPTPDIAQTLCTEKRLRQIAIGFALQTSNGETNARRKLKTKHLDGIVLNSPATLGSESGTFSFLSLGTDSFRDWGHIGKAACAKNILDAVTEIAGFI